MLVYQGVYPIPMESRGALQTNPSVKSILFLFQKRNHYQVSPLYPMNISPQILENTAVLIVKIHSRLTRYVIIYIYIPMIAGYCPVLFHPPYNVRQIPIPYPFYISTTAYDFTIQTPKKQVHVYSTELVLLKETYINQWYTHYISTTFE